MGRGRSRLGRASAQNSAYTQGVYSNVGASEDGLGLHNGGETDRWMASLSSSEYDAIYGYTNSDFIPINQHLRAGDVWAGSALEQQIANIESGINGFNLQKPTVFHRGSSDSLLGGGINTAEDIRSKIGQVVVDNGFTSTSATASQNFGGHIVYHIKTPAGKGAGAFVQGISRYGKGENEFLFNHGSGFKIVGGYEDTHGQLHCNMEYVGRLTK